MQRKSRKPVKKEGPCFMCKREGEPEIYKNPAEGRLATGSRIDYRDTYSSGEYKRIVFRGYVCEMHANSDDIVSIRYL